jgi:hypothetical protein
MVQRDFIKDEIERLGRVFGKLITMILATEGGAMGPSEIRQIAQEQLRDEFDFDIDEVLELSRIDLMARLDEFNLLPPQMEQLGDFLTIWAKREEDPEARQLLFRRALLLFDMAGERSGTYSMIRADKEAAIRAELV